MYRYKRLSVSKLFIQPSKINSMGLIQRLQSVQITLLGYCTLGILVRNSFGQIYIKAIFWSKDTSMKLSPPHPVSCESTTWRKATALILNKPAWRATSSRVPLQRGLPEAALLPEVPEWISTLATARNGLKIAVVSSPPAAFSEECLRGRGWGSQVRPTSHREGLEHTHLLNAL